ncbi:MAG TPA: hypothetical protein DDW19_07420 [Anaerolineaceae bacterium]|jgi:uncharacterized integral membrane protein|nr:hypothetical protein [Anaerolineaceae bacterium]
MKLKFGQVVGGLIILIVLIFALANFASVEINVIFTVIKAPLFLVIIGCLLLGMLAQFLFSFFRRTTRK